MTNFKHYKDTMILAVNRLFEHAPDLAKHYHLSGTMPITLVDCPMVCSYDVDLQSNEVLSENHANKIWLNLRKGLGKHLSPGYVDPEFGNYRARLYIPEQKTHVDVDILGAYEPLNNKDLRKSKIFKIPMFTMAKYLERKAECISDRDEPKDWYHLASLEENGVKITNSLQKISSERIIESIQNAKKERKHIVKYAEQGIGMKGISIEKFYEKLSDYEKAAEKGYLGTCTEAQDILEILENEDFQRNMNPEDFVF